MIFYIEELVSVSRGLLLFLWIGILSEYKQLSHSGTGHTEPLAKNQIVLLERQAIPFLRLFFAVCFEFLFLCLGVLCDIPLLMVSVLLTSRFLNRKRSRTFPTIAIESGWSETLTQLRDDMNLLLIGGDGYQRCCSVKPDGPHS